jgi:hypothetical protein
MMPTALRVRREAAPATKRPRWLQAPHATAHCTASPLLTGLHACRSLGRFEAASSAAAANADPEAAGAQPSLAPVAPGSKDTAYKDFMAELSDLIA